MSGSLPDLTIEERAAAVAAKRLGAMKIREIARAIGRQVVLVLFAHFVFSVASSTLEHQLDWKYYQMRVTTLRYLLSAPGLQGNQPFNAPDEYKEQQSLPDPSSLRFFSIKDNSRAMRVYLTAAFQRQKEMRQYADQLRAEGVDVVSAWHDLDSPSADGFNGVGADRLRWLAMLDIQQLSGSNVLVTFSDKFTHQEIQSDAERGGDLLTVDGRDSRKHVDAGMAMALGKRLLLVGPNENCYHTLPDVEHFPAWPECFARILELRGTDAMTTSEAADEAGTTVKQITMWIRDGSLPAAKRNGRYVVGRNDLDRRKAQHLRARADAMEAMNHESALSERGIGSPMWLEIPKSLDVEATCRLIADTAETAKEMVYFEFAGAPAGARPGMSADEIRCTLRHLAGHGESPAPFVRLPEFERWRKEVMTTLQDTQTLVAQLQQLMQTIQTNQEKIATDFAALATDIATLITDYQSLGGGNQSLIDSINESLQGIQTSLTSVATGLAGTDQSITGEDATIQGVTNPPAGGSGSGSQSPAPAGEAGSAGASATTEGEAAPSGAPGSAEAPATTESEAAPTPQGPLHGVSK